MLVVGLVLATAFLVSQARRLYFFGDDWEFLLNRNLSWSGLMEPHNEHWSFLPVLAFRTMVKVFGIDHYLAYALMPIVLHLACCVLLYLLMRRHELPAWPSVVSVLMLGFLAGNIGENPLWDFQIGFLGSAALGLLALLLASGREPPTRRLVLVWVVSALSMMCSGMALPMLGWLGLYVWIRRDLLRALAATVPPAVFYLIWFIPYGRGGSSGAPRPTGDLVFAFAGSGIATPWEDAVRLTGVGGLIFLLLLAVTLLAPLTPLQRALTLSGVVVCMAAYVLLGVSRAGLGPDAATVGRYAYFAMLYSLPAFAAALGLVGRQLNAHGSHLGRWALAVLGIVLIVNAGSEAVAFTSTRVALDEGLRGTVIASAQLAGDKRQKFVDQEPSPLYNPDVDVKALARPYIRAELPETTPTGQDLLDASILLQVGAREDSLRLANPSAIGLHRVGGNLKPGACSRLKARPEAWIDLPPSPDGAQIRLTSTDLLLPVQLISDDLVSAPRLIPVSNTAPFYLATTSSDATLRITLSPGVHRLCQQ